MSDWLVLRVFAGLPLKLERDLGQMGIEVFCPAETIKRRHPFDKTLLISHRKPLLPGYLFAAGSRDDKGVLHTPFSPDDVNTIHVKTRWLAVGNRIAFLTGAQMAGVRAMAAAWRPDFHDLMDAFCSLSMGIVPKRQRFVSLGTWQTLAKTQGHDISSSGRAA